MKSHVIYWWNPLLREREFETFTTERKAKKALKWFRTEFPWNHYTLARDVEEAPATAKWPGPYSTAPTLAPIVSFTGEPTQ